MGLRREIERYARTGSLLVAGFGSVSIRGSIGITSVYSSVMGPLKTYCARHGMSEEEFFRVVENNGRYGIETVPDRKQRGVQHLYMTPLGFDARVPICIHSVDTKIKGSLMGVIADESFESHVKYQISEQELRNAAESPRVMLRIPGEDKFLFRNQYKEELKALLRRLGAA